MDVGVQVPPGARQGGVGNALSRGATYFAFQLFPQDWQMAIFWLLNFCRVVPLDFFHNRLEVPSVTSAVVARAALFVLPRNPVPLWAFLPPVWTIWTETFSEVHWGQFMVWYFSLPGVAKGSAEAGVLASALWP